jgi:hypothetical protein
LLTFLLSAVAVAVGQGSLLFAIVAEVEPVDLQQLPELIY